jgi:RNA polymerase sigma-32 factor
MTGAAFSPLVDRNLAAYYAHIRGIPLLDAEPERALATRWRTLGDREAANRLVTSHLRLVAKIAWGYRGYGLPVPDLIAEGSLGMIEAVRRFDPDRGFRLATYAQWWIRAQIQDYVLRSWSLVRVATTAAQRKLFFNLRRLKARLNAIDNGDLSAEDARLIAAELDVPQAEVVRMNRRLSGPDDSLNVPQLDGDGEWQDRLVDERADQEASLALQETSKYRRTLLSRALGRLSPREREVVSERRLRDEPIPLAVIAERYGVTAERIRQIERSAFARLEKLVREMSRTQGVLPSKIEQTDVTTRRRLPTSALHAVSRRSAHGMPIASRIAPRQECISAA